MCYLLSPFLCLCLCLFLFVAVYCSDLHPSFLLELGCSAVIVGFRLSICSLELGCSAVIVGFRLSMCSLELECSHSGLSMCSLDMAWYQVFDMPGDAAPLYNLGVLLCDLGRSAEAKQPFAEVIDRSVCFVTHPRELQLISIICPTVSSAKRHTRPLDPCVVTFRALTRWCKCVSKHNFGVF